MGDRSNIIVLNDRIEIDTLPGYELVTGIAIYSHWGGVENQVAALEAIKEHGLNRIHDTSYFNRIVARTFTHGDDGETGSGITPVAIIVEKNSDPFADAQNLRQVISDNDGYPVPIIDLVNKEITLRHDIWGNASIIATYTGIDEHSLDQTVDTIYRYINERS